nr:integrin alpha-9-like isoform X1 [Danaus plexippus plexippus]
MDRVASDFRKPPSGGNEHQCHLGSSLAVTDAYFFTCAPLCSKYLRLSNGSLVFGTFGTCFVYDGENATRYCGLLEKYEHRIKPIAAVDKFYGGVGWTTFSDYNNKIILIAKSILKVSSITYIEMDSPLNPVEEVPMHSSLNIFYYKGRAFASGKFFNDKRNLYAFSMKKEKQTGAIAFLYYDKNLPKKLQVLKDNRNPILILDNKSVSMFGTSLHSVDINGDDFSELIVGAPGFSQIDGGYENGAIYLYEGGGPIMERREPTHRIKGTKDGARFGSSIASTDLDEDGLPEIFVSAPYENGGAGAVYILLGYEVKKLLRSTVKETSLSSFMYSQTLQISEFKSFGYSLHAFNRNGVNFLSVGAPASGQIAIYRSISFINATLSMYLAGDKAVREQDENFIAVIKIHLGYPEIILDTDIKLFLCTELSGDEAKIQNKTIIEFNLSKEKPTELKFNIVVLLARRGPGDYKITAKVKTDLEMSKERNIIPKEFNKSLVMITPQSNREAVLEVSRHCKGDECVPQLSTYLEWSGRSPDTYLLGSSVKETMRISILNEGSNTYDSCAWIKVTGAQVAVLACVQIDDTWYKCDLRIERDATSTIDIQFDLSHPTNMEESLNIKVLLFNHCASLSSNATSEENKKITYKLTSENLYVEGSSMDRNFTESELKDLGTNDTISVHETYKITNNASISWKSVKVVLSLPNLNFMQDYLIVDETNCKTNKTTETLKIQCFINIDSNSTYFIRTIASLSKSKMRSHFANRQLILNSTLMLFMLPTTEKKTNGFSTRMFLQKDSEFWESETFIITVSTIAGLIIVVIIAAILFKMGFFVRKEKKKLNNLRDSIRKGTFRRPSAPNSSEARCSSAEIQTKEN